MRVLLTLDHIESSLSQLPGWKREGTELVKNYRFTSYLKGIEFVTLLAQTAESMNHHPDLFVGWRKVTVRLTTHSAGGITSLDIQMAQNAEQAWAQVEEQPSAPSAVS